MTVRVQFSWQRTLLIIQRQSTLMFNITFVRDMIEEKKVSLMKVDTLKNVADSLTKSMSTEKRVMYLGGFSAHGFCRWFSISG